MNEIVFVLMHPLRRARQHCYWQSSLLPSSSCETGSKRQRQTIVGITCAKRSSILCILLFTLLTTTCRSLATASPVSLRASQKPFGSLSSRIPRTPRKAQGMWQQRALVDSQRRTHRDICLSYKRVYETLTRQHVLLLLQPFDIHLRTREVRSMNCWGRLLRTSCHQWSTTTWLVHPASLGKAALMRHTDGAAISAISAQFCSKE